MSVGVHAHAQGGCVIQRCQNKNPRFDQEMWMTSCTGWGFRGFWKKSVSWVLRSEEEGWLSLAHNGLVAGTTRVGGRADGKASIERLCLSPFVEKSFNSKVIKSFVPEQRSRKCFSCFGIPMFYVYMLWTFYVRFTRSHIHVWVCYTRNGIKCLKNLFLSHANRFPRRVDTIIGKKMVAILNKFTFLCPSSYFVVYFFKSKLILSYNRVIYHYTRIFLILLSAPCTYIYIYIMFAVFINISVIENM